LYRLFLHTGILLYCLLYCSFKQVASWTWTGIQEAMWSYIWCRLKQTCECVYENFSSIILLLFEDCWLMNRTTQPITVYIIGMQLLCATLCQIHIFSWSEMKLYYYLYLKCNCAILVKMCTRNIVQESVSNDNCYGKSTPRVLFIQKLVHMQLY
jgi:hypothetical protein